MAEATSRAATITRQTSQVPGRSLGGPRLDWGTRGLLPCVWCVITRWMASSNKVLTTAGPCRNQAGTGCPSSSRQGDDSNSQVLTFPVGQAVVVTIGLDIGIPGTDDNRRVARSTIVESPGHRPWTRGEGARLGPKQAQTRGKLPRRRHAKPACNVK